MEKKTPTGESIPVEAELFVHKCSIVRRIWGRGDTVLLIFAGASAEFALNKSVDWLYFTGRLPADPLGRLFSTVSYAQQIVFATLGDALDSIGRITAIHNRVEEERGGRIPAEAYLDVLFMLIDYSIRAFELLERKLTEAEKTEVFAVFDRVGSRMGLQGLPGDYPDWVRMRERCLQENLVRSHFSIDLYRQYRKHLGSFRYLLLLQAQVLLVPARVHELLSLPRIPFLSPVIQIYRGLCFLRLDSLCKWVLLPGSYRCQVRKLDLN